LLDEDNRRSYKMLNFLSPPVKYSNEACTESWDGNINNDSLVFEFEYKETKVLFMGDAEIALENYLLESNQLSDVDILKAGHHCSDTSSGYNFLEEIDPELVICSYAEGNKYGHPSSEVLKRFEELGIEHVSTADEGNIVVWL
jgi:competence protein ComEC